MRERSRTPEHVRRRERRDARRRTVSRDAIPEDRLLPRWSAVRENFFPSLGRSFDAFGNLISPQFIFDRDGWTQEQRAVGSLVSDTARFFLGMPYGELERLSQDPRDVQHVYPHLSQAAHGFVETTPLGSRGWTGFVEYLEQEPAELPLELALMGAGKAVTGARRLMRAATPFDADVFHRTDLLTGQRLPSAAEASVAIQTYRGARLLEEASGIRVGPQTIATASHVVAGQPGMPFSPTVMTARGLEGNVQTGMIRGVQGILPEADIALLEAADVSDAYLPLSDLVPGLSHQAVGDLGAGLETFGGAVGPRTYTDLATGASIGETTLVGRGGLSGAGLIGESGEVSGVYLGELHQRGLFATGGTVLDFQTQIQGQSSIPVSQLHTGTIVDAIRQQGLHYRLARQDPTLSASPFLIGSLALHGRYGVQDPFSLVRMDPERHREFPEGPMSGVFAYEGDIRDMLLEIKDPTLGWERRQMLLDTLHDATRREYVPDIFREGDYDVITAVPSSIDRLRTRGFNQAEFYAEIFEDVLGIPFERDLVQRVRETTESSGLEGLVSRAANLRGAFIADPSVSGRRVLTVDDIIATGTTMRETLSALSRAGAVEPGGLGITSTLYNFQHPRAGFSRFAEGTGTRVWGGVDFTTAQQQAISHVEGPAVISAVPGAGKTDVLVQRVQELMAEGVSPSEVLTVAYNRAAIDELATRFEAGGLSSAQARTIHSLAHEIVMDPDNFTGVGFSHRPKIARDLTQERFRQMMREYPDAQVDFEQSEAIKMAAAAETDEEWLSAYQAFKSERGLLTFGQMLDVGGEILETRPEVRQRYLERYPFLQIDEFQDVSQREWNFLSKFTPNVLGVGDINQAIYGFRGATGDVMADLYQRGTQYDLPETFRSTPEIFQTAQRLIALNEQQIPVAGRSVLPSGSPVDFRSTTGESVFDELESILASRGASESTAVLVRTNREIRAILDRLGEEAFENVDIGTIHKGKGQGWDRVILPTETVPVQFGDSLEKIWSPRLRSQVDIENARRVGYVGLTRARQHAHVLGGGDLFEEMRTGERHLQLHGRSGGLREGFSYGFGDVVDSDVASLSDLDRLVRDTGRFFRATDPREDSFSNISLDWQQTLKLSHRLQQLEPYDLPLRGEESALFPREFYEKYKRELDYMLHPESYVGESPWEPGMMGVYRPGIYVGTDLEMMFKQAFWNPEPRYHMGGRELRIFEGDRIMEGFVSGEPSFYAPSGETIIRPRRQIGTFDYSDIYDLRTGEDFTGMPMELQYEMQNYSLRDLRSLDELEGLLRLHGSGGTRNVLGGTAQTPGVLLSSVSMGGDDELGIDINSATAADLQQLPGVGPGLAHRIISYRNMMGGFGSSDELGNIRGMSDRKLALIQPHIFVGASYLPRLHSLGTGTGEFPDVPSMLPSEAFQVGRGLDINVATVAELEALPGIGQASAERIIANRTAAGNFPGTQSLTRVKGIGSRLLSRMEPSLLQFGPEPHPDVSPEHPDAYDLPLPGVHSIGHATPFDIPIPGYQRSYSYPSDMRDHIPLYDGDYRDPSAPLWGSANIEDVPLESGFEYSLRKFQERQGGATRFPTPTAPRQRRSYRDGGYQYTFGEGIGAEFEALPSRAAGHLFRHGTDGFADMLLDYPGKAIQRQGMRVLENYGSDALRSLLTGGELPGLSSYLGETTTGLLQQGAPLLGPLAVVAGAVLVGESSLDANYADVIESEEMRKQRFYDRFRKKPLSRSIEVGGKAELDAGGLERLIEGIVKRVLAEGADDISDKLVTRIGRKVKLQMQDGRL